LTEVDAVSCALSTKEELPEMDPINFASKSIKL